jgi:hypothetical protein
MFINATFITPDGEVVRRQMIRATAARGVPQAKIEMAYP